MQSTRVLRRARVATSLLFLLFGMALGTWTVRIPAVKHGIGLGDGQLSIALLAFAAGAISGMQAAGRLTDRYGSTRLMVPLAVAEGVLLVPPAYLPNLATLAIGLFVFGTVHGALNIAMNANAIEVQRAWGGPIMSSFHAVYSIGGFLGATIGGLCARAGLSAGATFLAVGCAVVALALWAGVWALPSDALPGAAPASSIVDNQGVPITGVLFLGVLAFCALVGEGAAADWSAVYLLDDLTASPGFAAAGYAAFAVMMTVGRLFGDRLTTALGPVALVRLGGLLAALGLGTALLVGEPVAGVVGFACLGAGMSCIAPQVYSAAGARNPTRAGTALSRVVSMGYAGFLTGPILIGGASTVAGLPRALTIPVVLALFVAMTATALRPRASELPRSVPAGESASSTAPSPG